MVVVVVVVVVVVELKAEKTSRRCREVSWSEGMGPGSSGEARRLSRTGSGGRSSAGRMIV